MKTPQTDDIARGNHVVPTAWAQNLERQRDFLRQKYDNLATEHMLAINKICNQRDEAITTIEDAKRALKATDYEGILLAAMRVKEERDQAVEEVRLLKGILDLIKKDTQ
ncbi:hypothetical protein UFOVP300_20 [uncultured Caudovirales phage]|uniref:Uncharacterized protein n=1 Tax=uncultured Caudovirales phage TaxID=2100421 RepID=A0A6J5LN14_9CAUD|nr:hypothetical protein UFOVP300_20 [uncultured Caudovirales phage]